MTAYDPYNRIGTTMLSSINGNVSKPQCSGFVMAQDANDPYDIRPCPDIPSVPTALSQGCRVRSSSCARGKYCEYHHCAWCKKESDKKKAEADRKAEKGGQDNTAPESSSSTGQQQINQVKA